jgi:hypothetical protein
MKTVGFGSIREPEVLDARVFRRASKWGKSHDTTELCRHQLPLK